jgi:endonuclease/exonuclease/phosphatase family metal-dependent hydrolase
LKLLSYNIRFGGESRGPLIASVIRECDPDIVILQEATNPDIVKQIAADAGMPHWASRHGHSLGFISQTDIAHYEWQRPEGARHSFLEIRPAGLDVTLFGVHLSAVHSNLTERRRLRELNALLDAIKEHRDTFHLVTGDFNTLAPGERLDMSRLPRKLRLLALVLGGRIRFRTIQAMLDAGYSDSYRQLHSDEGYTFPTWDPHVRLDYYFVPSGLKRVVSCEVVRNIPSVEKASDHFPLMAMIDV